MNTADINNLWSEADYIRLCGEAELEESGGGERRGKKLPRFKGGKNARRSWRPLIDCTGAEIFKGEVDAILCLLLPRLWARNPGSVQSILGSPAGPPCGPTMSGEGDQISPTWHNAPGMERLGGGGWAGFGVPRSPFQRNPRKILGWKSSLAKKGPLSSIPKSFGKQDLSRSCTAGLKLQKKLICCLLLHIGKLSAARM